MTQSVLAGIRVLDFSNSRAGLMATQTLADFGANVIFVEPRGGSRLRDEPAWPSWGRGRRSIQLNLTDPEDQDIARQLALTSDVLVETFRPGVAERLGIGYEAISAQNDRLVYASVTGFGRGHSLERLQGYDGIVQALFGAHWLMEDMAQRPGPAFCTVAYPSFGATQLALHGILAALYEREESGLGQRVETTLVEGLSTYDPYGWFSRATAMAFGEAITQVPRVVDGIPTGALTFRVLVAAAKDGEWLQFSQSSNRLFRAMLELFGLEWMYEDPRWKSVPDFDTAEQRAEFWQMLLDVVRSKTADEWLEAFDGNPDVWAERYRHGSELLDHPQLVWNQMVAEIPDPELGAVRAPGPIARLSATPARVGPPAPQLGEHDEAIRREAETRPPLAAPAATNPRQTLPLEGVTIVELASFYAAPYGTVILGELGARIIKLEELEGDPHRNLLPFPEVGGIKGLLGKESVAVDLRSAEGKEIALRIMGDADVVVQAFRAGAAERLGIDTAAVRRQFPHLIYHNAPGYGVDGPYGRRPAFAPTIGAAAGIAWRNAGSSIPAGSDLTDDMIPDASLRLGTAVMVGGNSDGASAIVVATAILLGVLAKRRGGGGQEIFTSMLSSNAHLLSEMMVQYEGCREPTAADPQLYGLNALYRLYEASDGWIFVASAQEHEWRRLVSVLPSLADRESFESAAARRTNDALLAATLATIFRHRPVDEWVTALQDADIACVPAANAPIDRHFIEEGSPGRTMGLLRQGHHPILGDVPRQAPLVRFSRSLTRTTDASLCGQATALVLQEAGYSESEIDALEKKGVVLLG